MQNRVLLAAALALAGVNVAGLLGAVPAASVDTVRPAPQLAKMCGFLRIVPTSDGRALCTHGPDPAPEGVDFRIPRPLVVPGRSEGILFPDPPGDAPSQAAATPGLGCYGDGTSGNRIQAVYAFPADRRDRYAQTVPSIRHWAAELDAVFQQSAAETGGVRRLRFVTDQTCDLVVARLPLSARGDDTLEDTVAELAAQGYNRSDRKYLIWMDSTVLCGIGTYYVDDRPTPDNLNNANPVAVSAVARIDAGCWGLASRGESVEGHELMHSLGAVLPTAPNATIGGHCNDDADRMCYADGSPLLTLRTICGAEQEALFDCDHDDYFHTAPPRGSYLATHWDAANSSFLSGSTSIPFVSIGDAAITEGDSGTVPLAFPVSLSTPSSQPTTVRFATADASARAPDDYVAASGTLTFKPGETAKGITVLVKGDLVEEVDEPFSVVLTGPANGVLDRATAFGTILDNEPTGQGYWFVASDGGIFAYNSAFLGSTGDIRLNRPIVDIAATPTALGYWMAASDGGIFSFGDARFLGSTGNLRLNRPIVAMAATPTGNGYWLVASDGGIFSFGDARFLGSTGDIALNQPIVDVAATPSGQGYWLVASDGGVFAFGDARFFGVPSDVPRPIVALAPTPTGSGYWMVGTDGAVYAYGDARSLGGTGRLNQPIVGMAVTPKGGGYWLAASDGGIFSFGDARFFGSAGNIRLNRPIVGMTAPRSLRVD